MADKNVWIIVAVIAILVVGMFMQKNYGLFAGTGTCISEESTNIYTIKYISSSTQSGQFAIRGQSFQPSLTGKVDSITLRLKRISSVTESLLMQIVEEIGNGAPVGTVLWSYSVPASMVSTTFTDITFTLPDFPQLDPSHEYYLVLSTTSVNSQAYAWSAGTGDTYIKGYHYVCETAQLCPLNADSWNYFTTGDMYFKVNICEEGCTPNWQCSAWSTCTNNHQTRTCQDTNQCGTSEGQPATDQTCGCGCGTRVCGTGPCGENCGTCQTGQTCNNGQCIGTTCPTFQDLINYATQWKTCT